MSANNANNHLPSPYQDIGGENKVKDLVNRFYDLMDDSPEAYEIRQLHPHDLKGSREKLFKFLSGWLGGPQLYVQDYGHPRLRARHLPFPIDEIARDQWLLCMNQSLDEQVPDEKLKIALKNSFANVADHLRNQQNH